MPPDHADYLRAVQRLAPRQLANLIVGHVLATRLLNEAGMLSSADRTGLQDFRAVLRDASNATTGRWDISDVEAAGHRLAAEVEILRARPASAAMPDLVEEGDLVWDDLSGHLRDACYIARTEPEQITAPLLCAHRDLCESLDLDPEEITDRRNRLVERCHYEQDVSGYVDPSRG